MFNKKQSVALLLFALLLLTGCGSHRYVVEVSPDKGTAPATPEPETQSWNTVTDAAFKYYSANFSCTVEDMAVNGQIRVVHDSAIWISVSKFVELGRLLLTPDRVQMYVGAFVNKYFDGDYAALASRWGVDIDYQTVEALIIGNGIPNCSPTRNAMQAGDSVSFVFSQFADSESLRQVTMVTNQNTLRPLSIEILSSGMKQRMLCRYNTSENIDGQIIPASVSVRLRNGSHSLATVISLSRISLDNPLSLPFTIPAKYQPF